MSRLNFFFVLITSTIFSQEIKTTSKTKAVTIYSNGAQIEAEVKTSIPKGVHTIFIEDVSRFIVDNTIQLQGIEGFSIISIGYEVVTNENKKISDKIEALNLKINNIRRQIALLQNANKGLEEEETILQQNKTLSSTNQAVTLEKIITHTKYYRERSPLIKMEIYDNTLKINQLQNELNSIQYEFNNLNNDNKEVKGLITLVVENNNEITKNVLLTLKYNIGNAGWIPFYEIKAKNSKEDLQFVYKAKVYQTTGEDWNDVKVILSTGNPSVNDVKPVITPKYLDFITDYTYQDKIVYERKYTYNPLVKKVSGVVTEAGIPLPGTNVVIKGTNIGTQTDFDGKYSIEIKEGQELEFSFLGMITKVIPIYNNTMNVVLEEDKDGVKLGEVIVEGYRKKPNAKIIQSLEGQVAGLNIETNESIQEKADNLNTVAFKLNKNYTIPSLVGKQTTIEIDNFKVPAIFEYFTAPLLNESVFLTAKIKDWNTYDFLPGEASIYTEGTYAGITYLNPYQAEEELVISMGVDSNLVTERKQTNNLKDKSLLGTTRIVDKNYEITVKNNKTTPVEIKVYDRIPISQNKEIKVEDATYEGAEFDEKKGILFWTIKLEPKQVTKKQISYKIKYPKNKRVNLN